VCILKAYTSSVKFHARGCAARGLAAGPAPRYAPRVHEWALADAVVECILGTLENGEPDRLVSAEILIGELQAVEREIFDFALRQLLQPRGVPMERVSIIVQPAEFRCGVCGRSWNLKDLSTLDDEQREAVHFLPESLHAFVRCPGCGSADFRVEKGRGVSVGRIVTA
jgi:hydrogenase nickel incorporation protein HypA/HybF